MINDVIEKIDFNRIPWFVCIGTSRSYVDGISPRIGTRLKGIYRVTGTEDKNVDNITLKKEKNFVYDIDKEKYQVIAIDCVFSFSESKRLEYANREEIIICDNITPASSLNSYHREIGCFGIGINVCKYVMDIAELLTPIEREDIKELEDRVFNILKNIKEMYSEEMKEKINKDLSD